MTKKNIAFMYKGKLIRWNGKKYSAKDDPNLNELQRMHLSGDINLYEPIEAYYVKWDHDKKGNNHKPIAETRIKKDLPCISQQWKEDYNRRNKDG